MRRTFTPARATSGKGAKCCLPPADGPRLRVCSSLIGERKKHVRPYAPRRDEKRASTETKSTFL